MPVTLNKTAVTFNEFRVQRELQPDGVTYEYSVAVGYRVETAEGEAFGRDRRVVLAGAQATRAADMFAAITGRIKSEEGLP